MYWGKYCELIIEDPTTTFTIQGLRTKFKIQKEQSSASNKALVSVYNLDTDSLSDALKSKEATLQLVAGYETAFGRLFKGDIIDVRTERFGADVITELECATSFRKKNDTTISTRLAPGSTSRDILQTLADTIGLNDAEKAFRAPLEAVKTYPRGLVLEGNASELLGRFCGDLGILWTSDDDALSIVSEKERIDATKILVSLDIKSGLLSVSKNLAGVSAVSILDHRLTPGTQVEISYDGIEGLFVCKNIEFKGDTHGEEWSAIMLLQ